MENSKIEYITDKAKEYSYTLSDDLKIINGIEHKMSIDELYNIIDYGIPFDTEYRNKFHKKVLRELYYIIRKYERIRRYHTNDEKPLKITCNKLIVSVKHGEEEYIIGTHFWHNRIINLIKDLCKNIIYVHKSRGFKIIGLPNEVNTYIRENIKPFQIPKMDYFIYKVNNILFIAEKDSWNLNLFIPVWAGYMKQKDDVNHLEYDNYIQALLVRLYKGYDQVITHKYLKEVLRLQN